MKFFFLLLALLNLSLFLWNYQKSEQLELRADTDSTAVATLTLVSELPSESLQEQPLSPLFTHEVKSKIITEAKQQLNVEEKSQPLEPKALTFFCFKTKVLETEYLHPEVEQMLLANDVQVEREETALDVRVGYWVIIPPAADRNAALETVQRLQEQGVTDVRRFTEGALVNAISLGLFRKKEYAERRSNRVKEKGFKTKVKPRMRSKKGYILHIKSNDRMFPDSALWSGIATDKGGYQLQREPCRGNKRKEK